MRQTVLDLGKKRARERGGILVIAIIVILAMLILAIPFLFKLSASNRSTERAARALSALNLAEAGVDKYMWYIDPFSDKSKYDLDTERLQLRLNVQPETYDIHNLKTGDLTQQVLGDVRIVLTPPVGVAPNPQTRTLTSTGMIPFIAANTVDRSVRVTLERYYKSIFDVGFFVDERFDISTAFKMGSYNSNEGPPPADIADADPNAIFGMNSYYSGSDGSSWFGNANIDINGSMIAGGDAAELFNLGQGPAPDPTILEGKNGVIDLPNPGEVDSSVMNQKYQLPAVDVFDLPPKEILGDMPAVGEWFENYDPNQPSDADYYVSRTDRAPLSSEVIDTFEKGPYILGVGETDTLSEADNGIYSSFILGQDLSSAKNTAKGDCTLNIQGNVVLYVTALADATAPTCRFTMGSNSQINLIPQADGTPSKLTLILGDTSFVICDGYNFNAQPQSPEIAPKPADLRILGTNQFNFDDPSNPSNMDFDSTPKQLKELDDITGLMHFEQGKSSGNLYAAIYAPSANFGGTGQGENHMNLFGACITKYMSFKNQVDFLYDEALADLDLETGGFEYWKIISWQEKVGN